MVEIWNQGIEGTKLPKARLTPKRRRVIAGRLKEDGWLDDFRTAVPGLTKSKFHLGQNERGWLADIDYLLQAGKATQLAEKIRSGSTGAPGPAGAPVFRSAADQALADQLARRGTHGSGHAPATNAC